MEGYWKFQERGQSPKLFFLLGFPEGWSNKSKTLCGRAVENFCLLIS